MLNEKFAVQWITPGDLPARAAAISTELVLRVARHYDRIADSFSCRS